MAKSKKVKAENKKSYGGSITLIVLGSIAGFIGYFLLQSGFISESALATFTGTITDKGEYEETSRAIRDPDTGIKERTTTKFYYIKLEGLSQRLSHHNLDERYEELDKALNIGDKVTVSYLSSEAVSDLNVYEIKKDEQIVLDSSGKRTRYKIGGFVFVIGALFMFAYAIRIWGK